MSTNSAFQSDVNKATLSRRADTGFVPPQLIAVTSPSRDYVPKGTVSMAKTDFSDSGGVHPVTGKIGTGDAGSPVKKGLFGIEARRDDDNANTRVVVPRGAISMRRTELVDAADAPAVAPKIGEAPAPQPVVRPVPKGHQMHVDHQKSAPYGTDAPHAIAKVDPLTPHDVSRMPGPDKSERAHRTIDKSTVSPRKGERAPPKPGDSGVATVLVPPFEIGGIAHTRDYDRVTPKIGHEHRVPFGSPTAVHGSPAKNSPKVSTNSQRQHIANVMGGSQ
eukprot:comp16148_c0_seq1/m.25484 comp16148_c0_seq1/g.25484  ORF comp16148_c0_seq1/g.25484 comp16148_c0_seq1/m.25484 type:complete len:276 (-) comp16148_c0_seq1:71-898(-)